MEFAWYIKYPDKCKLITTAFSKDDDTLRSKIEKRYKTQGENIYYKTLENIDTATLRWDKHRTAEILKWFLLGFKEDFISKMNTENSVDTLQREFAKKLKDYIEILKFGLETKK